MYTASLTALPFWPILLDLSLIVYSSTTPIYIQLLCSTMALLLPLRAPLPRNYALYNSILLQLSPLQLSSTPTATFAAPRWIDSDDDISVCSHQPLRSFQGLQERAARCSSSRDYFREYHNRWLCSQSCSQSIL